MDIYLLTQKQNGDWDTFDAVVVAAESEEEARKIHPHSAEYDWFEWDPVREQWGDSEVGRKSWASHIEHVDVAKIGTAAEGTRAGVILASYNAG